MKHNENLSKGPSSIKSYSNLLVKPKPNKQQASNASSVKGENHLSGSLFKKRALD